ncbi:hypothetical protein [Aquirufa sp.]|jgi:hypothetical protein|uniref:hypothetical protein n=1 Tax=Aquirufa sp. TaxID=2676249 RepID=UPI0037837052
MKKALFIALFSLFSLTSFSQQTNKKGSYYITWGYNRSSYANSDIRFVGPGYDFTLLNAKALDFPTPIRDFKTYVNPELLSIPQFNFHAGYFIKDNLSISIGWDHMKYVVTDDQIVRVTGFINPQTSTPAITVNPAYVGTFNQTPLELDPDEFVHLEHTDGYNYASIEIEHYKSLFQSKKSRFAIDWIRGVGIGALVPRSDVHVFGVGKNNYWNLAGGGASLKTGLKFNFSKLLFFETTIKTGATKLWDIRTTGRSVDHAEQAIYFMEFYGALGFTIKGSSK